MKAKIARIFCLVLTIVLGFMFVACEPNAIEPIPQNPFVTESRMVGSWEANHIAEHYPNIIALNADGSAMIQDITVTGFEPHETIIGWDAGLPVIGVIQVPQYEYFNLQGTWELMEISGEFYVLFSHAMGQRMYDLKEPMTSFNENRICFNSKLYARI